MNLTDRLAGKLRDLRRDHGWSLDQLAGKSGVSRAALSRLEQGAVSPTAEVLGKLCAAYGLQLSQLMMTVEDGFAAHVPFADQAEWRDPGTGYSRRAVSPPSPRLGAEIVECHLPPDSSLHDPAPQPGTEHHLVMLDGALRVTLDDAAHDLTGGDCLRYHLSGTARVETGPGRGARYLLILL